jgi:hypothetical protein
LSGWTGEGLFDISISAAFLTSNVLDLTIPAFAAVFRREYPSSKNARNATLSASEINHYINIILILLYRKCSQDMGEGGVTLIR